MNYCILFLGLLCSSLLQAQATNSCLHQYIIHIEQGFELTTQEQPDYKKALACYDEAEKQAKKCDRKDLRLLIKGRAILLDRIMKQYQAMKLTTSGDENALKNVEQTHAELIEAFDFDPLALVCREGQFGYVDETGQLIVDYAYKIAEPFDANYFAEAKQASKGITYLIDGIGRAYPLATSSIEMTAETRAFRWEDDEDGLLALEKNELLEVLLLNLSFLGYIPRKVGTLTKLKHLDLYFGGYEILPPFIGNLKELEYLHLGLNQFKTLPKEIGKLKALQYLNLTNNELERLPEEIFQLTALRELYLDSSPSLLEQKEWLESGMPWCKIIWEEYIEANSSTDLEIDDDW